LGGYQLICWKTCGRKGLEAQEAIERFLNDEISLGELEDALGARRP